MNSDFVRKAPVELKKCIKNFVEGKLPMDVPFKEMEFNIEGMFRNFLEKVKFNSDEDKERYIDNAKDSDEIFYTSQLVCWNIFSLFCILSLKKYNDDYKLFLLMRGIIEDLLNLDFGDLMFRCFSLSVYLYGLHNDKERSAFYSICERSILRFQRDIKRGICDFAEKRVRNEISIISSFIAYKLAKKVDG